MDEKKRTGAELIRKSAVKSLSIFFCLALTVPVFCKTYAGTAAEADVKAEQQDAAGAGPGAVSEQGSVYRLPVFETSDIHGYLADTSKEEVQYRLAYISDKVKDVRGYGCTDTGAFGDAADSSSISADGTDPAGAAAAEETDTAGYRKDLAVLLDSGDLYQGNTMSNLVEGQSISAAFMMMDYDAVAIGNHEFDWGIENMVDEDKTMQDYDLGDGLCVNDIPVICANLYQNEEPVSFADPYIILEKTAVDEAGNELPVRIGVIGFADNYGGEIMYSSFAGAGYSINADCGFARFIATDLKENEQCDAVILLVHGDAVQFARDLGEDSGIDLVLGGHTHQNRYGVTSGNLTYLEPANKSAAYGYAELVFEKDDRGAVLKNVENAQVIVTTQDLSKLTADPKNAQELDPELVTLTDEVIEMVLDLMGGEIGYITVSAERFEYIPGSGERATTCGNWNCSIISRAVGADVAFTNGGALRENYRISSGSTQRSISASDVYEMFPFENRIYLYEITWEELLELLELSLTEEGSSLFTYMTGVYCYYTDQTVNALTTADGQLVYADGVWQEGYQDQTIRLAVNEYMATMEKEYDGRMNPLVLWNETDRLLDSDQVDVDGALTVLTEEASQNDGLLTIDTNAYFVEAQYSEYPDSEE